ncbi:MAG: AMIN domain-containing protein, partial [Myxococcales bacterium]
KAREAEQTRLDEERRIAEQKAREEAERRRLEEERRIAEQRGREAEQRRLEEERRIAEQKAREEAERRRLEEERRIAEQRAREAEQKRLAEERRLAEQRRLEEERRIAEREARRQLEEQREQLAAAGQPAFGRGGRGVVERVGFKMLSGATRVIVRTSHEASYSIGEAGSDLVVLELRGTGIGSPNNRRFLDTSFFDGPVARITPRVFEGGVRIEVQLKHAVHYQVRQDGGEIFVDFGRIDAF